MVHRLQKELMKWLQTYETRQLVLAGDVGAAPCSYIRYSRSCGSPNEMHIFLYLPLIFALATAGDIGAAPCSSIRYSRSCGSPDCLYVFPYLPEILALYR